MRYFVDRAPGFHPKFLGAQEFTRKRHLDPFIRFDNVNTCKKERMFAVRTVKTRHPLDVGVLVTDKIVLMFTQADGYEPEDCSKLIGLVPANARSPRREPIYGG